MENVKENDNLIILGDCNAIVGEGQEGDAVGKYGLRVRNNRGQRCTDFCKAKELLIKTPSFNNIRDADTHG